MLIAKVMKQLKTFSRSSTILFPILIWSIMESINEIHYFMVVGFRFELYDHQLHTTFVPYIFKKNQGTYL